MRARLYKYTHTQTAFTLPTVINSAKHAQTTLIIKHKYMLMCNHKICINVMLCLWNCTVVEPQMPFQMSIGQFRITCSLHHPIRHVLDNTPACPNSCPSLPPAPLPPPPLHLYYPMRSRVPDVRQSRIIRPVRFQTYPECNSDRTGYGKIIPRRHSSHTGRECTEM